MDALERGLKYGKLIFEVDYIIVVSLVGSRFPVVRHAKQQGKQLYPICEQQGKQLSPAGKSAVPGFRSEEKSHYGICSFFNRKMCRIHT